MKCLLCPKEIDEVKSFQVPGPVAGQNLEDQIGRAKHVAELAAWNHLTLTAQEPGGSRVLLSGHACPAHLVDSVVLAVKGSKS